MKQDPFLCDPSRIEDGVAMWCARYLAPLDFRLRSVTHPGSDKPMGISLQMKDGESSYDLTDTEVCSGLEP